jgi:hypothetical protein
MTWQSEARTEIDDVLLEDVDVDEHERDRLISDCMDDDETVELALSHRRLRFASKAAESGGRSRKVRGARNDVRELLRERVAAIYMDERGDLREDVEGSA